MPRERHKAIAIPVSLVNDELQFLIVHDRRYKEWTFVTGGCRRREVFNPLQCALRELEEESRGVINLKRGTYSHFKFITDTPEPRDIEDGVDVLNTYHVYVIHLHMTDADHQSIISKFTSEMDKMDRSLVPFRKNYDENDGCKFENLDYITNLPNLWPMIREHVVSNPEFAEALHGQHRVPFHIAY